MITAYYQVAEPCKSELDERREQYKYGQLHRPLIGERETLILNSRVEQPAATQRPIDAYRSEGRPPGGQGNRKSVVIGASWSKFWRSITSVNLGFVSRCGTRVLSTAAGRW